MKAILTAQQTAFFTQNGYIEFEFELDPTPLFESARKELSKRLHTALPDLFLKSPEEVYAAGRDLWRTVPALQTLLTRKLSPIAQSLLGKKSLRLGCDQWIPASYLWEKAGKALPSKDLFSIQGLALGLIIGTPPSPPLYRSPLGLLPLPSQPGNILFFRPNLILDWPELASNPLTDLYIAAYALPNAVYVQNLKDPMTNALKQFGYGFGDPLINEFHPLLPQI
jgi:hypothetical protein